MRKFAHVKFALLVLMDRTWELSLLRKLFKSLKMLNWIWLK